MYARGVLGLTPLCAWNSTKTLLPAQRVLIVFAYICLLICRLNANTTEWMCMQISRNIVNGPKRNNYVLLGIWIIVCIQKPSPHFLQTFRPSLYPLQLSLFCLLRLINGSADRSGYITNFCSVIELLHEFNAEAFRHLILSQQRKRKTKRLLDFHARNQLGTPGGRRVF